MQPLTQVPLLSSTVPGGQAHVPLVQLLLQPLLVLLTPLPVELTARRGGSSLTDTDEGCQRAPYEGCSHQPKRLSAREGAAGKPSGQLV
jgi:hypothetical protein